MTDSNQGYPTGTLLSGIIPDVYGSGTSGPIIVPTGAVTNVDGSDRQFVIDYTTSTAGMSGDTVNINGGNDQFVVLVDSPAAAQAANDTINVAGGNDKFVVDFKSSAADASQNDNNVVNVGGGNNQFVVSYQYPTVSSTPGDQVQVNGGNNQFVVAHSNGSSGPYDFSALNGGAATAGGSPFIPPLPSGTFVGTTLPPAITGVTVDGSNNQYVVSNSAGSGDSGASTVVSGSSPLTEAAASVMSLLGSLPSTAAAGAALSNGLTTLLGQSPFGALLNLAGVTPETLFGNLGSPGSGANPFGSIPAGSNPFTNYPGSTGPFSTATSAGGSIQDALSSLVSGGAAAAASLLGIGSHGLT